jgi:phosphoenolpyruvate carboxylase
VRVIRAFTYFSHLANLAEDRHLIRRRTEAERAGESADGRPETALARIRKAGVKPDDIVASLAHSYVSPVLTAHPTEVQRKSILDAERAIAQLLTARDEIKLRQRAYAAARTRSRRSSSPPTKRRCARASRSSGRRACCASPSSPWPTRSRTR